SVVGASHRPRPRLLDHVGQLVAQHRGTVTAAGRQARPQGDVAARGGPARPAARGPRGGATPARRYTWLPVVSPSAPNAPVTRAASPPVCTRTWDRSWPQACSMPRRVEA